MLVHLLSTPAVIHGFLLLAQQSKPFPYSLASWNWTVLFFTLTSMKLEEGPYPFTYITSSLCLNGARLPMFEQSLHLLTILWMTFWIIACSSVEKEIHVKLDASLPLSSLLRCHLTLLTSRNCDRLKRVRMPVWRVCLFLEALWAKVKVDTCGTMIAMTT